MRGAFLLPFAEKQKKLLFRQKAEKQLRFVSRYR